MSIDLEQIRSRNRIEDVVAEKFNLKKSGSRYVGVEHDSLVVIPANAIYFWNSKAEHGDVFDFAGRYLRVEFALPRRHRCRRKRRIIGAAEMRTTERS